MTPLDPQFIADLVSQLTGGYGVRPDGTQKGSGWLGELQTADGNLMTEFTASSDVDGRPLQYPLITPNQPFMELSNVLQGGIPTPNMHDLAIRHAISQLLSGKSQYAPTPVFTGGSQK